MQGTHPGLGRPIQAMTLRKVGGSCLSTKSPSHRGSGVWVGQGLDRKI